MKVTGERHCLSPALVMGYSLFLLSAHRPAYLAADAVRNMEKDFFSPKEYSSFTFSDAG